MTRHETADGALWRRIEAHLDARTDPFADPELRAALRADPERERATRRLLARLAVLQVSALEPRALPPRWRRIAPYAALAAAALLGLLWLPSEPATPRPAPGLSSGVVHSTRTRYELVLPEPPRAEVIHLGSERVVGWSLGPGLPR